MHLQRVVTLVGWVYLLIMVSLALVNLNDLKLYYDFQGTPIKDVKLPDNPALETLLLDKHAAYIEAFEKNKDDFVSQK